VLRKFFAYEAASMTAPSERAKLMSAFALIATIERTSLEVRKVPLPDSCNATKMS
jgi:hypothetical protein